MPQPEDADGDKDRDCKWFITFKSGDEGDVNAGVAPPLLVDRLEGRRM